MHHVNCSQSFNKFIPFYLSHIVVDRDIRPPFFEDADGELLDFAKCRRLNPARLGSQIKTTNPTE
jgi:hypothetical protein